MRFDPFNIYHVFNQGNNKQKIFQNHRDYLIFLDLFRKLLFPFAETICWCLMPNHFHFLMYTDERVKNKLKQGGLLLDPLTNGFRKLQSSYARIYNNYYDRSGSLFRQKTKTKCLTDISLITDHYKANDYILHCFHYIHQNPLKAGIIRNLDQWEYSSYRDYAGLRNGNLCNKLLAEKYCNYSPDRFILESSNDLDQEIIKK